MFAFIKWFWASISFRNWTFGGDKLRNPFAIMWRLLLYPIIKLAVLITAFLYLIAGDKYNAGQIYDDWF